MVTRRYIGAAALQAQISDFTVGGTVEVGDLFTLSIGPKTLSVAAASTTAADVAEDIAAAWAALDSAGWPEFAEITAQANGAAVRLTANEPGVPFFVDGATTEANGSAADAQTFVESVVQANSGPNDISLADNWSGSVVPVSTVDIVIDLDAPSMLWNLDALAAVVAASVRITCGRNTQIGLADTAPGGYPEHRAKAFAVQSADWFIETDSGLVNIDTGTATATAIVCRRTGQRTQENRAALCVTGANATNTFALLRGDVAIQQAADETARFAMSVGFVTDQDSDVTLYCGPGATLGAFVQNGGQVETWSAISPLTMRGGRHVHNGGGITSPAVYGGQLVYNTTATLAGTPKVGEAGHLDFSADPRAKAITNPIEVYGPNAKVSDPFNVCNPAGSFIIDMNESAALANITVGANRRVTFAATA